MISLHEFHYKHLTRAIVNWHLVRSGASSFCLRGYKEEVTKIPKAFKLYGGATQNNLVYFYTKQMTDADSIAMMQDFRHRPLGYRVFRNSGGSSLVA